MRETGLTAFTSTSQAFFTFIGNMANSQDNSSGTQESFTQMSFESADTLSNPWCRVKTAALRSSTVVLRKNANSANETFSITSNTTGAFADVTHTDTIASGDLLDVAITSGSIALLLTIIATTYAATTNTVTRHRSNRWGYFRWYRSTLHDTSRR